MGVSRQPRVFYRMRLIALALLAVSACGPSAPPGEKGYYRPSEDDRPTAVRHPELSGHWRGTLLLGTPSERAPAPAERSAALAIIFAPETSFYAATLAPMIGQEPPDRRATAGRTVADTLLIRLGSGFDRGELELHGVLEGDSLVGRWGQIFYSGGARGRFLLRRSPKPSSQ